MTSSSNRRKRKGADAAVRLAKRLNKKSGLLEKTTMDPFIQAAKILALEEAVSKLVEAQQINHQELFKAFHMTDAHLWVLLKLCEHIVADCVLKNPNEGIDIPAYYNLFNEEQMRRAALAGQVTEAITEASSEEDIDVFGGDASQKESVIHAPS